MATFPHPAFPDLRLHDDGELEALLGVAVAARATIHEWPLSCVQRLDLADGTALVYKTQLPPTVEPEFYARASSPLLCRARDLGRVGACRTTALEWIDLPRLRDVARDEAGLVAHGRELVARVRRIEGDLPVHLDVGSRAAWLEAAERTLDRLDALVASGRFRRVPPGAPARLRAWARSGAALCAVEADASAAHGDLKADQVFVGDGEYRVVDWQRPVRTRPETDLVSLLVAEGVDPSPHADGEVVRLFWFLRLVWAVEAQVDIFPDFPGDLFERWSLEAAGHVLAP